MDKLSNMKAFAQVAQLGSFAGAATQLGIATSVVSKRVKDLESFLGAQLFYRTTRKISLTETGYTYLEHVRRLLGELEEVEDEIRHKTQKPIGEIKIGAPLSFSMKFLGPIIADYLHKYEDVSIKIFLSDRIVDLIEEGYDLSIRVGHQKDSSLISKKLSDSQRIVCASPSYYEQYGKPKTPSDLTEHNCMNYTNLFEGRSWPFVVNGKKVLQPTAGRFNSDNGDLLAEAAVAGCGITMLPSFIVGPDVHNGNLEVALEGYEEPDLNIYAVYPNRQHLSTKVRLLIDHFEENFKTLIAEEKKRGIITYGG